MTARVVYDGSSDGVTLGDSTSALAGCYGSAVAQAAAITAPATTASTSTTNAFGYTTSTQADAIVTAVNALITAVKNFGITA
jgi:hypothetical protein